MFGSRKDDKVSEEDLLNAEEYSAVNLEREAVALSEFNTMVGMVCISCKVNRPEAIRRMIIEEKLSPTVKSDIEKFFWMQGVSKKMIKELTDEVVRFIT